MRGGCLRLVGPGPIFDSLRVRTSEVERSMKGSRAFGTIGSRSGSVTSGHIGQPAPLACPAGCTRGSNAGAGPFGCASLSGLEAEETAPPAERFVNRRLASVAATTGPPGAQLQRPIRSYAYSTMPGMRGNRIIVAPQIPLGIVFIPGGPFRTRSQVADERGIARIWFECLQGPCQVPGGWPGRERSGWDRVRGNSGRSRERRC
jgi:hypothetical protein